MTVKVIRADYADPEHGAALIALLDAYARDPMGGGEPLSDAVRTSLIPGLASQPTAFSLLAYDGADAIGLVNCFWGYSTFAARPLVNIHDAVVLAGFRGKGVARALFAEIERIAAEAGACKVTLEVLSGNERAKALYASLGYGDYALDPEAGTALFWQKRLAA
jgi:ribosomal protein S18 acetylase RimI-like enzyme